MAVPFLSIVIPTYNRRDALVELINSIFTQDAFDETIEIVVSDNCSTDGTCEAIKALSTKRLKYIRRERNMGADDNFLCAIEDASGIYVKLHNDNKPFMPGALRQILEELNNNSPSILLTTNGARYLHTRAVARTMDELVEIVSYNCTWLSAICFLKSVWLSIKDKNEGKSTFLIQTYFLFRMMEFAPFAILNNRKLFSDIIPVEPKGGYNLFMVFGKNYLDLLWLEVDGKQLSHKSFYREKNRVLFRYILPMQLRIERNPHQFVTDLRDSTKFLAKHYAAIYRLLYEIMYFLKKAIYLMKKHVSVDMKR